MSWRVQLLGDGPALGTVDEVITTVTGAQEAAWRWAGWSPLTIYSPTNDDPRLMAMIAVWQEMGYTTTLPGTVFVGCGDAWTMGDERVWLCDSLF
jgi:hypothetical protein